MEQTAAYLATEAGATAAVVRQAAAGDRAAFAQLVQRYSPDMIRAAYVVSSDIEATHDATQRAWQRIWSSLGQLRDQDRFRAWAIAIAVNEVRAMARQDRRRQVREISVSPDALQQPDIAELAARRVDLGEALRALEPDDRALLALRYVAGMTAAEIAASRGGTASGIRARLSRLNGTLREELER